MKQRHSLGHVIIQPTRFEPDSYHFHQQQVAMIVYDLLTNVRLYRDCLLGAFLICCVGCVGASPSAQEHLSATDALFFRLASDHLVAEVMRPEVDKPYYRGKRFERSGMITRVTTATGHSYFGPTVDPAARDPLEHDHVSGTAEEFDIRHPPGFREALPGETFLKIGVGLLRRPDTEKYRFGVDYELVDPGRWTCDVGSGRVTMIHRLEPSGDGSVDEWGYEYTKTVALDENAPVITIQRRLKNIGTRRLVTEHYGHNFILIDDLPVGPAYQVDFGFPARFGRVGSDPGMTRFHDNALRFTRSPEGRQKLWMEFKGFDPKQSNSVTVHQLDAGASVTITHPRDLSRVVVFSRSPYVAPEMFTTIELEPEQEFSWSTVYRFDSDR